VSRDTIHSGVLIYPNKQEKQVSILFDTFGTSRVLLPVIHCDTLEQVRRNANIASTSDADGVFLIQNNATEDELFDIANTLYDEDTWLWIGVNCLRSSSFNAMKKIVVRPAIDGLWTDDAGIQDDVVHQDAVGAYAVKTAFHSMLNNRLYFGGVAFKGQQQPQSVEKTAVTASRYMDVVTTTGDMTGVPPSLDKIKRMRRAVGPSVSLAIASGITVDNVGLFLPYTDAFLVATGISRTWTELDPIKVKALANVIHAYGTQLDGSGAAQ